MGKKISIDSATMINKVFEVIEAKKIFDLQLNQIDILINPNSYIHAIVIFYDGTIKILAHENNMSIPIYNSIYEPSYFKKYDTKFLNLKKINKLKLTLPNPKKFDSLKILKLIPVNDSLYETVIISANDELVRLFLDKKIKFKNITFYLNKIINFKIFNKYYKIKPNSIEQILYVRNLSFAVSNEYFKKNI